MNLLFITQVWPQSITMSNMYTDLVDSLSTENNKVTVLLINEKRNGSKTSLSVERGCRILRVRCGNIQKTNKYTKVLSSILAGPQLIVAVKKYLWHEQFDGVIWALSTTLITSSIIFLKNHYNAKLCLLLKEYWPQDPTDLGAMKENGILYKFFEKVERKMLKASEYIGTCSEAGCTYVEKRISIVDKVVEPCPNCELPKNRNINRNEIRKKFLVPTNKTLFLLGGNLGLSQGISDLIATIKSVDNKNAFFLILGSGTEFKKVKDSFTNVSNVSVLPTVSQKDFFNICCAADVGLIFLFKDYRVPNIPGKFTTYLNAGLPILAAIDKTTDIGQILSNNNCGLSCISGEINDFKKHVDFFVHNSTRVNEMSHNATNLFEREYNATVCAKKICKFLLN